jgi:hypothetical protein
MNDSEPNNNSTHTNVLQTKEHKHEGYTVQQRHEIKTSQFPPYMIYVTCRVMNKTRMLLHRYIVVHTTTHLIVVHFISCILNSRKLS